MGDKRAGKRQWTVKDGGDGRESCFVGKVFSMRWPDPKESLEFGYLGEGLWESAPQGTRYKGRRMFWGPQPGQCCWRGVKGEV